MLCSTALWGAFLNTAADCLGGKRKRWLYSSRKRSRTSLACSRVWALSYAKLRHKTVLEDPPLSLDAALGLGSPGLEHRDP